MYITYFGRCQCFRQLSKEEWLPALCRAYVPNFQWLISPLITSFTHDFLLSYYSSPKHKSLLRCTQFHDFTNTSSYNLEYGLAIVRESFSPLILDYTTSFVKVQMRSDVTSHTILDTVYMPCTLNWSKLV